MERDNNLTQKFQLSTPHTKLLVIILVVVLAGGIGTGYYLATSNSGAANVVGLQEKPKAASQDNQTFRDFAEGTIQAKPANSNSYSEGTHILTREKAVPVALTSSVVDLSAYEGKKVKVYGETQKAIKEGWLMDVGKVEEI